MKDAGTAMMGIGIGSGENRAVDAAQAAINSQLLETGIAGATRVLLSIAGGEDLSLFEVNEAAQIVEQCADENANIIYGQVIDERMGDQVRVTVIATGFRPEAAQAKQGFAHDDLFAPSADVATAANQAYTPSFQSPSSGTAGRFDDEDYIPDFLKRQD